MKQLNIKYTNQNNGTKETVETNYVIVKSKGNCFTVLDFDYENKIRVIADITKEYKGFKDFKFEVLPQLEPLFRQKILTQCVFYCEHTLQKMNKIEEIIMKIDE